MRKFIPPELEQYDWTTRYSLIYEGRGIGDCGKSMDEIIAERFPISLIEYRASPVERRGRVYEFGTGVQRDIDSEIDYDADYSHKVDFDTKERVLQFIREQYEPIYFLGQNVPSQLELREQKFFAPTSLTKHL